MMDSLFDAAATEVVFEYIANDVVVCTVLRKWEGFKSTDIDL